MGAVNPKIIVIFSGSIFKILQMKKFNSLLNAGVAHLKSFPGLKAKQLSQHAIPILEGYEYDAANLHIGINNLLRFNKNSSTLVSISNGIINAGFRFAEILILKKYFFQACHSVQKLLQMLRKLNHFLYQACEQHSFTFIDNGAVKHNDLCNGGVRLLESGKIITADNLIHNINDFLRINQFI